MYSPTSASPRPTFDRIQSTTEPSVSSEEPPRAHNPDNPLGIKIKEITKPEEIRITDDKPKPFKPPVRTASTSSSEVTPTFDYAALDMNASPIEEEGVSSGLDELSEILPEEPQGTHQDQPDDLTPLDSPDERFSDEEFGVKNVRQTGAIPETLTSSEIVISDKLLAIGTSTDGSGELQLASSTPSSFDNDESIRSSTEDEQSSRIVIVDGQEFKVKAADGLQRGVDEEDDRKASRKNAHVDPVMLLATTADSVLGSTTEIAQTTIRGIISEAFDTVYYEPATEEPLTGVSMEIIDINEMRTSRPLTSSEIISIYEQKSMLNEGTVRPMFTSDEIIAQYEEQLFKQSTESGFDGSGMSLSVQSHDRSTEEPELEGSSSSENIAVSSTTDASVELASPTSEATLEDTSDTSKTSYQSHLDDENLDVHDKNPEYPEQADDYSLHSQIQEEEAKSRAAQRDHQSDDKPSADLTEYQVTSGPLAELLPKVEEEGVDKSSESSRQLHTFSDAQERSPGEPYLIPEWERNGTSTASPIVKFDRRDSLILLPVKSIEEKTQGPVDSAEFATREPTLLLPSTSGPNSSVSTEELSDESSTTEHHQYNEVSSAEALSSGDDFNFGENIFVPSKLNKFLRLPGDLFRYRERMMNS